jgi:heme exporter protein CcmD
MNLFDPGPFAAFINGSYAVSVIFLVGISVLTLTRYRRASRRLAQAGAKE